MATLEQLADVTFHQGNETQENYAIFYWWKKRLETIVVTSRNDLSRHLEPQRGSEHRLLQNVPLPTLRCGLASFDPLYQLPQPQEGDFAVVRLSEITARPVTVAWSIDEVASL